MNADEVLDDIKSTVTKKKRKRYSGVGARRSVRRPEEILREVRGLKLRQRVTLVLEDEILREELESSIKNSSVSGVTKLGIICDYQDILLPALQPNLIGISKGVGGGSASIVLPINDIRGESTSEFSKSERSLRCKLAAVYRLLDIFGWSETIYNHISVQPISEKDAFLMNPFGLLMSEVTSSSLVKIDFEGNIIDGGSIDLGVNTAGFVLHSTIYKCRPDVTCVIYIHTSNAVAVSSMKCGFLRISQESLIVGGVSYHDYCGILIDEGEKESIIKDLGPENMVMFLRNHGVVVCGKTIEDTFALLVNVMDACEAQVKAVTIGLDNLNIISEEAYNQVQETMKQAASNTIKGGGGRAMTLNEYEFEAHMRWMDAQGYRTGYVYIMPDIFVSRKLSKRSPECRVPPNVMSDRIPPQRGYYNYHGLDGVSPHLKPQSMGLGNTHRARLKWLNSPVIGTQYTKEESESLKYEPMLMKTMGNTSEVGTADVVNAEYEVVGNGLTGESPEEGNKEKDLPKVAGNGLTAEPPEEGIKEKHLPRVVANNLTEESPEEGNEEEDLSKIVGNELTGEPPEEENKGNDLPKEVGNGVRGEPPEEGNKEKHVPNVVENGFTGEEPPEEGNKEKDLLEVAGNGLSGEPPEELTKEKDLPKIAGKTEEPTEEGNTEKDSPKVVGNGLTGELPEEENKENDLAHGDLVNNDIFELEGVMKVSEEEIIVETVKVEEATPTEEMEPVITGDNVPNQVVVNSNIIGSPTDPPSMSSNNPTQSSNSLGDKVSTEGGSEDGAKQKVKKQTSFKMSLMKKLSKKDESK